MEATKIVAYYRVSTLKQDLGLDAQRTIVSNWATAHNAEIIAEYQEKESGKDNNRPELIKAKEKAEAEHATLVVAKLDRLSRDFRYIVELFYTMKEKGASFVVCNLPELNTMTLAIFGALAEEERRMISERTKQALAELKAKGVKLGNPNGVSETMKERGRIAVKESARNNPENVKAWAVVERMLKDGETYHHIAVFLNSKGYVTRRGCKWCATGVMSLQKVMMNE